MKRPKRPREFSYQGKVWKIRFKRAENDGNGHVGDTDLYKCTIDVYTGNHSIGSIKDTLLHELLHVVFDGTISPIFHIKDSEKFEEEIVLLTTPKVLALFGDNPHLVEFLFKN